MNRNVSSPFFVYICNCCFSNGVCYLNLIFMKIFRQEISESHYNIVKGERVVELLCRYKWFVLGENGADEMLTFREDGLLTISNKGKRRQGVWRYNTHARLVYLSKSPHSCYLSPFFWNKVVLVLRLREEDGYLFLINAAAKRFDCMVLEDFNAYASQWEQGQAVKREKVGFLKKMRSEPVKLVSKWEEMGVGEDLPILKKQLEQPQQLEPPPLPDCQPQVDQYEENIRKFKESYLIWIKSRVEGYLQLESYNLTIETDLILSKDKKYKKMKRKKIIIAITMAALVVFAFSGFWSTIQYDETNSYFESVAYSSFLFIGAVSTILVYCVHEMNEESYKMELKQKIEEKLRNNFINSLKL